MLFGTTPKAWCDPFCLDVEWLCDRLILRWKRVRYIFLADEVTVKLLMPTISKFHLAQCVRDLLLRSPSHSQCSIQSVVFMDDMSFNQVVFLTWCAKTDCDSVGAAQQLYLPCLLAAKLMRIFRINLLQAHNSHYWWLLPSRCCY